MSKPVARRLGDAFRVPDRSIAPIVNIFQHHRDPVSKTHLRPPPQIALDLDDLQSLLIAVLLQVRPPPDDKTVKHANPPPSRQQLVNKVAADKARATSHNIQ